MREDPACFNRSYDNHSRKIGGSASFPAACLDGCWRVPVREKMEVEALERVLVLRMKELGPAVVALSGGVDSAVVAKAAFLAHGTKSRAATAVSPSVSQRERSDAQAIARQIGIAHDEIETDEFSNPLYVANDGRRCYHCKAELYAQLDALRSKIEAAVLVSGAHRDDLSDDRPGLQAAAEHGVVHPLMDVGFGKQEIRSLARLWNLSNWDKPASPCLSSRIAIGLEATAERVQRVEHSEDVLYSLGFRGFRVRYHPGDLARIEFQESDIARLLDFEMRQHIVNRLKEIGFRFVSVDLAGYQMGSLNTLIEIGQDRALPLNETR
jgi:uncharacterized protein